VVFVLAWTWLSLRPDALLHPDSSRDLSFARDLADGVELHMHGAWAAYASLLQGSAWIDLLALCRRLGLGVPGIERVMTTLLAGAVAAAQLGVARLIAATSTGPAHPGARLGTIAGALLLLASLPATCEMPVLWQPLLLPVPAVFAHLAAWRVLERGELIDGLALALMVALASTVHVIASVLVPPAILIVALACRVPGLGERGRLRSAAHGLLAAAASVGVGLGFVLLRSSKAVFANLRIAGEQGWLPPVWGVGLSVLVLGLVLRPRFAALGVRRRLELAVGFEALLVGVIVLASFSAATPALAGRYLLAFAPGLVLAAALLAVRARSGLTAGMIAAVSVVLLATSITALRPYERRQLPFAPTLSQAEFELVAGALAERGITWVDLVGRLQGPDHEALLGGAAAALEPGTLPPPAADTGLLLLALEPARAQAVLAELESNAATVELSASMTMLIVDTPARLDRHGVSLCLGDGTCTPVTLAVDRRVAQAHPNAWIDRQPSSEWLVEQPGADEDLIWRFPVRPGPAATIILPPEAGSRCAWSVVAAEGVEVGELPAALVELPAEAVGSLTISREVCEHRLTSFPPAPVELAPGWARLRAILLDNDRNGEPAPGSPLGKLELIKTSDGSVVVGDPVEAVPNGAATL